MTQSVLDTSKVTSFENHISQSQKQPLKKSQIEILQANLGKLCNLNCIHCHVEAGPTKTEENMGLEGANKLIEIMDNQSIQSLDLTGGAPELNPHFRTLVKHARNLGIHVIDRCNLAVLFEPGQEDLADFLADNQVEVVASLPCYSRDNVDKQRGNGTFEKSIQGLKKLNDLGYGLTDSKLTLNLVYNPVGPHLPPAQDKLTKDYKAHLREDFGIEFNQLYTITNMPITRYRRYLKTKNKLTEYEELLKSNFNPSTLSSLMCINTLNVSWDGSIYDCDFNQMLNLPIEEKKPLTIFDLDWSVLKNREIRTAKHCYGCTAGAGSSCQGALE